jgi:hypothetical protein
VDEQQLPRICCQIDGDYFSLPKVMCSLQSGTQADPAQCRTCCAVSDPALRGDDGAFSIMPVDQCAEDRRLEPDQCDSVCCKKGDSGSVTTRYACLADNPATGYHAGQIATEEESSSLCHSVVH